MARGYVDQLVLTIAANNSVEPTPMVRTAIRGFIAFAETVLGDAHEADVDPEQVAALLGATLTAAIAAAR